MALACPRQHPWVAVTGGIRLTVRVTPRAGRDAVAGLGADADGQPHVAVRVAAAPTDGSANDAVTRLLAKWLDVAPGAVTVASGQTLRLKTIAVTGDPIPLLRRCQGLA